MVDLLAQLPEWASLRDIIAYLALVISFLALWRTRQKDTRDHKIVIEEKRTQLSNSIKQEIDRLWAWRGRMTEILLYPKTDAGFADFLRRASEEVGGVALSSALDDATKIPNAIQEMIEERKKSLQSVHKTSDAAALERMYGDFSQSTIPDQIAAYSESLYTRVQKLYSDYLDHEHRKRDA